MPQVVRIFPLLSALLLMASAHAATPRTVVAKVQRVSDGDTLVAMTENQTKLQMRLLGIDAREATQRNESYPSFGNEDVLHYAWEGESSFGGGPTP